MTRTAIRHTLTAVAAVALVSAFASSPVFAQSSSQAHPPHAFITGCIDCTRASQFPSKGLATKKQGTSNNYLGLDTAKKGPVTTDTKKRGQDFLRRV